jgi:hypothetical protein
MPEDCIETFRQLVRNDTTLATEVEQIITSGVPADLVSLGEYHCLKFTWEQLKGHLQGDAESADTQQVAIDSTDLSAKEVTIISSQYTSPLDDAVRKAEQRKAAKQIVQQT